MPTSPPVQPEDQLHGIPDPHAISSQKTSISRGIDDQLLSGEQLLAARHRQQTDYIDATVLQQKKQYALDVDRDARQQEMMLTQQFHLQVAQMAEQLQRQKLALEKQAAHLTEEYNVKSAQERLAHEQYHLQMKAMGEEKQMQEELTKLQTKYATQQQAMQQAQVHQAQNSMYAPAGPERRVSLTGAPLTTYSHRMA